MDFKRKPMSSTKFHETEICRKCLECGLILYKVILQNSERIPWEDSHPTKRDYLNMDDRQEGMISGSDVT